ncbi:ORF6N domain-containing protein [Bacillus weihaiensis]|uniref:ORF6N domain-containing protein n=1 Tax=Bacillus weihaiensis TaxID=1547283 RepID=UPI0023567D90|nr:ORF6N domain-containing protein [Bacillus weihaiensis]
MKQLKIIGTQNVAGHSFTGIEGGFGENKRAMLVKEIAEIHNQPLAEINRRINNNKNRFKNGVDIIDLLNGSEPFRNIAHQNGWIGSNRTQNVYILSERGYSKLLKILEDDKAWDLYEELVDGYFNMRQVLDYSNLSPELQMFQSLFQTVANQQLKNKELENRLIQQEQENKQTKSEVKGIREVVALSSRDWRKDTTSIINKIAVKQGGYDRFREVRKESYELLEKRAGAKLQIRLVNKQKKMALEGASKSKINNTSKLDVIDEDKRLLEIYLSVVKEMAIRYSVDVSELKEAN